MNTVYRPFQRTGKYTRIFLAAMLGFVWSSDAMKPLKSHLYYVKEFTGNSLKRLGESAGYTYVVCT